MCSLLHSCLQLGPASQTSMRRETSSAELVCVGLPPFASSHQHQDWLFSNCTVFGLCAGIARGFVRLLFARMRVHVVVVGFRKSKDGNRHSSHGREAQLQR